MKISEPYSIFPEIYDPIMEHINFQAWANFILTSIEPDYPKSLLDIGCGTGSLIKEFPDLSLKMGIDKSKKMLEIARFRYPYANFLEADMKKFEVPEKFDLVVCTHDSLNYLIESSSMKSHFNSVYKVLEDRGYYFFDISSEYNLKKNFHNQTIRETYGDVSIIWENDYNNNNREITSTLTFEVHTVDGTEYFQEIHIQRYYPNEEIIGIAEEQGFEILRIGSDYKKWKLDQNCSLINFLAKKINGK